MKKLYITSLLIIFLLNIGLFFVYGDDQDEEAIAEELSRQLSDKLKLKKGVLEESSKEVKISLIDQIVFNPENAKVKKINVDWKIVDGDHWIFSFGKDKVKAERVLEMIRFYGINRVGFIGRPEPDFTYLLTPGTTKALLIEFPGKAPEGEFPKELCAKINMKNTTVKKWKNQWAIMEGNKRLLYAFGDKKEEAYASLFLMTIYNFSKYCTIKVEKGKEKSFTYLKK